MSSKSVLQGIVVSDQMQKSVVVAVERQVRDPLYGKIMRRTSKFMAHDEKNVARTGDRVEIIETRPMSRRKRWRVTRVVERAVALRNEASPLGEE
ncbi:MAG: 30S ribosomal protein S17 [Acidobacteria bacterium]|nr:30S ribosomal protein S17 [Acidobacteriota bacterium]